MNQLRTPTLHAIAEAVVPESRAMTPAEWAAFDQLIANALARRPARIRRQLALFLHLLNVLSYLRFLRALHQVQVARRTELLSRVQDSKLLLLRRGFWGIRTLVFMGYYARPECAPQLGYAAAPRGWELRR